jgi:threonine/homoserine/homoserine lactone efflux protein
MRQAAARLGWVIMLDLLPALIGFAFVSSITPGPNNLMLLASGANFGLRRSLPHMLGISVGHSVMVILVGLGLIGVFEAWPPSYTILKWVSVAYLLWLAWKIGSADPAPPQGTPRARPMSFLGAALFQWVNPKAWYMALTAISAYLVDPSMAGVILVALVFAATNLPSIAVWTVLGEQMRRLLTSPARMRAFNVTMAVLLVATLWPILMGQ